MSRRPLFLASVFAAVSSAASAQIPERFENLQVFPRDIPRDTLVAAMRGFTAALGVRCQYCHVEREQGGGGGGLNLNFASDDKQNKRTARFMLRMVDTLNRSVLTRLTDRETPPVSVRCVTCHRGLSVPTTIEDVLVNTATGAGIDSALTQYRALRGDMESGRFNFSEQPVNEVARRFAAQGRHDDAIALLRMNQEFHPNSLNIDFQIADTYVAKGDTAQAITRLRAVLAKSPDNRRAAMQLQRLGAQP